MWEYRAVRWPVGQYTSFLNTYALEGWELVQVVRDEVASPAPGRTIPMPGTLGRIGAAADTLGKLGGSGDAQNEAEPSALLWILRRPLADGS
jgi:hypothetical protein